MDEVFSHKCHQHQLFIKAQYTARWKGNSLQCLLSPDMPGEDNSLAKMKRFWKLFKGNTVIQKYTLLWLLNYSKNISPAQVIVLSSA